MKRLITVGSFLIGTLTCFVALSVIQDCTGSGPDLKDRRRWIVVEGFESSLINSQGDTLIFSMESHENFDRVTLRKFEQMEEFVK